jgi:hypothetical protein
MISSRRSIVTSSLAGLALVVGIVLAVGAQGGGTPIDRPAPEIAGGPWINSQPLAPAALRGRVIFVEFWTYG